MLGDRVIYQMQGGKMTLVNEPISGYGGGRQNFVIVCDYGDWSGFRTLAACQHQFPELEQYVKTGTRPDGFYRVVERL